MGEIMSVEMDERKEFLFYYEVRQSNPNGDPGFENQPRLMPDGTILVTDVRVKRTIRDYAKTTYGKTLFVDVGKGGKPVTADVRAQEIVGNLKNAHELLSKTFDGVLFGVLVPIRKGRGEKEEGEREEVAFKATGPVQFGLGRSVNQVEIIDPTIFSRFVGREKSGRKQQFGTFGKFYSVEYALIKIPGVINPMNLNEFKENKRIMENFKRSEELLLPCLWDGTNALVTRSKYPQRSILYLEVTYNGVLYNDLPLLVKESETMRGKATSLDPNGFDFTEFKNALEKRKEKIKRVRVKVVNELAHIASELQSFCKKHGIKFEVVP
ncbi:MAG: type I CRISPR-associated protein Cas7 [Candidatus Micrarchaeia archaeon]